MHTMYCVCNLSPPLLPGDAEANAHGYGVMSAWVSFGCMHSTDLGLKDRLFTVVHTP